MVPHEYIYPTINATGGTELGIKLPVSPRGIISKLIVYDLSTTAEGFTYQLYNASIACPPGNNPTTVATGNNVVYELYQVSPQFTVASGKRVSANSQGSSEDGTVNLNLAYVNMDTLKGNSAVSTDTSTNPGNALYLKLNPSGSGAKKFAVALTTLVTTYT